MKKCRVGELSHARSLSGVPAGRRDELAQGVSKSLAGACHGDPEGVVRLETRLVTVGHGPRMNMCMLVCGLRCSRGERERREGEEGGREKGVGGQEEAGRRRGTSPGYWSGLQFATVDNEAERFVCV